MSWVTPYIVVSWICGAAVIYDAYRRPHSQWVAADRDRSWWVMLTATLSFFAMGPFIGLFYLLAVVPLFSRERRYDTGGFEKRP